MDFNLFSQSHIMTEYRAVPVTIYVFGMLTYGCTLDVIL